MESKLLSTDNVKILVTGARGLLGQDLCPILRNYGFTVIETDHKSMDITDYEICREIITKEDPDIIINCAAYTNVNQAEIDREKCDDINIIGPRNLAVITEQIGACLVHISTDYVFSGIQNRKINLPVEENNFDKQISKANFDKQILENLNSVYDEKCKPKPWLPDEKPWPVNYYGLSKYFGELTVKNNCKKYYIARTSALYGKNGKCFVNTMITKLLNGDSITVVNDQTTCPTWTKDLAHGIVKLFNLPYGTYHVCGDGETTWFDFTREIVKILGFPDEIKSCKSKDMFNGVSRPKYSVMRNFDEIGNLCRNWKTALREYIFENYPALIKNIV